MKRISKMLLGICMAACFAISPLSVHAAEVSTPDTDESIQEEIYNGELQLLACLVYAEAGNQDLQGKEYVADVVLNRVDNPQFPNSISEVIFQDAQFSVIDNGMLNKAYYTVTQDCFDAVAHEISARQNSKILYFCSTGYNMYGTPEFRYQGHYFSS